ncbi:MAG: sulfatase-like hydrolase/transferase, partial [Xanthomonadales bacterium]|nr:sulfatase-like hydrolase/transferase [Xanthomonadales bacterium]
DQFITVDSAQFAHASRRGYYVDDQALTSVVLGQLKDSGPAQFVLAISMENHGPYLDFPMSKARQRVRDQIRVPAGLQGEAKRALQNYLLRQRDADAQLGRLADALAQRQRPSLLVFYGDHLPGLGAAYAGGFDDGRQPNEQPVPFLLIEPGAKQPPQTRSLPAWMLAANLLHQAGVHDDHYFALLQAMQPTLAAKHWQLSDRVAGELDSVTAMRLDNKTLPGSDATALIARP